MPDLPNDKYIERALEPCPFCGTEMELIHDHTTEDIDRIRHKFPQIACPISGASGFNVGNDNLISAWNTRALARTLQEQDVQGEPVAAIVKDVCELPGDNDPDADDTLILSVDDLRVILERHLAAPTTKPQQQPKADWLTEAREALHEAKLQLEYLDGRFPTGTTPVTITRVDAALEKLREAGHG